jgi:hypothetical protein
VQNVDRLTCACGLKIRVGEFMRFYLTEYETGISDYFKRRVFGIKIISEIGAIIHGRDPNGRIMTGLNIHYSVDSEQRFLKACYIGTWRVA